MTDLQTQNDIMLPAAIREQVRQAGHHPDSKSGERLVEWAKAQAPGHGVPTVAALVAKAAELNLKVETPATDPATVEDKIAEARAEGNYALASRLQTQVDAVRNAPPPTGAMADEESKAIAAARERAEAAQAEAATAETETERMAARKRATAAWWEASKLQSASDARRSGAEKSAPPEPHPQQPTGGLTEAQLERLQDTETPLVDRLRSAVAEGDHTVASILQTRLEREGATA